MVSSLLNVRCCRAMHPIHGLLRLCTTRVSRGFVATPVQLRRRYRRKGCGTLRDYRCISCCCTPLSRPVHCSLSTLFLVTDHNGTPVLRSVEKYMQLLHGWIGPFVWLQTKQFRACLRKALCGGVYQLAQAETSLGHLISLPVIEGLSVDLLVSN